VVVVFVLVWPSVLGIWAFESGQANYADFPRKYSGDRLLGEKETYSEVWGGVKGVADQGYRVHFALEGGLRSYRGHPHAILGGTLSVTTGGPLSQEKSNPSG
jgi:hypothetical protein